MTKYITIPIRTKSEDLEELVEERIYNATKKNRDIMFVVVQYKASRAINPVSNKLKLRPHFLKEMSAKFDVEVYDEASM